MSKKITLGFGSGIFLFLITFILASPLRADDTEVKIKKEINSDEDSSIIIKKGSLDNFDHPDYETVPGEADIEGDPALDLNTSRANWKTACEDWKKEVRGLNKEHQILSLNCGSPSVSKQEDGQRIYKSKGTYKLRVRTHAPKDGGNQSAPTSGDVPKEVAPAPAPAPAPSASSAPGAAK